MTRKQIAVIALVMVFVFGSIVVIYPLIFSPQTAEPIEATPAQTTPM